MIWISLGPVDEFRDLVKALHRAGIEVILDVVYNQTAEGNAEGPTLCFHGLANEIYHMLDQDRAQYANYSGTGSREARKLDASGAQRTNKVVAPARAGAQGSAQKPSVPACAGMTEFYN